MKNTFKQKHPLLSSILFAIVTIIFMVVAGVIVSVSEVKEDADLILIQAICIWFSAIVGLLFMKFSNTSMREYGFHFNIPVMNKKMIWFLPPVIVEICALFTGFNQEVTLNLFFILLLFTIGVGINEEVYYRGLILKILEVKGTKYAIIGSSVIFGVGHVFNALAGKDALYITLQIIFAALFGFVCAEIVILTKNILVPIIWHALHDLVALTTSQKLDTTAVVILCIQTVILLLYAIYLWKKGIHDVEEHV